MERIKSINWKLLIYWFVVMSIMNVYIIPTYIIDKPITIKRVVIGILVSLIVAFIMGLLSVPKPDDDQE